MSEAQPTQRDDSPMDVDQPSPLEQDSTPLGMIYLLPFVLCNHSQNVILGFPYTLVRE